MKINSITLDNFKAYSTKKTFEFDEGINLIQGPNGKGKSTLLDVINLLIFNKTPDNTESLCNWSSKTKRFYINLDFDHDGSNYIVEMSFEKKGKSGTSERTLRKDGVEIAKNSDVNKYFSELFDIPTMQYALISGQRKAEIVDCQDSERRELLKRVQNLDYSKQVKNNIEPQIAELKSKIEEVEKQIYLLENKEYNFAEVAELPFEEGEFIEKQNKVKELKESIETLVKNSYDLERIKEKETRVSSEIDKLKIVLGKLLVEKDDLNSISKSIEETNELVIRSNKKKEDMKEQVSSIDMERLVTEKEKELSGKLNEVKEELNSLLSSDILSKNVVRIKKFDEEDLQKLKEELVKETTKKEQLETEIDQLSSGICPVCKKPSEVHEDSHRAALLSSMVENIAKIQQKIEDQEKEKILFEGKKKENDELKEAKRNIELSIERKEFELKLVEERLKSDIKDYRLSIEYVVKEKEQVIKDLEKEIDIASSEIVRLKHEYSTKENNINENFGVTKKEIEKHEKRIEEINETKNTIQKSLYELPILRRQSFELGESISNYKLLVSERNRIEEANKEVEKQQKRDEKDLKTKQTSLNKLTEARNDYQLAKDILLKDFPNFVIDTKIDEIEYDMNKFIEQIYDKELNIKFKKNKSSIKLIYGNSGISVKGGASGAESKLCQLAFINSFNQQLNLNCLILDEPGESADNNNSEKMYNLLGGMEDIYKQMIVITHKEEMKDYLTVNYDANVVEV